MAGWIKISRDIRSHWIWKDSDKLKWWLDILIEVNYQDAKVNIGYTLFECKRGQSLMSLQNWAKRWGVSKSVVNRFFKMLEDDKIIVTENETVTTRLTVLKYDTYQQEENASETQAKRKRNASETQRSTIKEREESKEDISVLSFDNFWNLYDKKVGDKDKIKKKYDKLGEIEKELIFKHIPLYKNSTSEKKYQKNPETYLNNKSWNDEIIPDVAKSSRIKLSEIDIYMRENEVEYIERIKPSMYNTTTNGVISRVKEYRAYLQSQNYVDVDIAKFKEGFEKWWKKQKG